MLETFMTGVSLSWEFVCRMVWVVVNGATELVHLAVAAVLGMAALAACIALFPVFVMLGVLDWAFAGKEPLASGTDAEGH